MSTSYHLSPALGWAECKAIKRTCPFGTDRPSHQDLVAVVKATAALAAAGKPYPEILSTTAGTQRPIEVLEDGTVRIGTRRYTAEGEAILSKSAARTARRRERLAAEAIEEEDAAVTPPTTSHPVPPPAPEEPMNHPPVPEVPEVEEDLEAYLNSLGQDEDVPAPTPTPLDLEEEPVAPAALDREPYALSVAQAEKYLRNRALKGGLSQEKLEAWLERDNRKQIAALTAALDLYKSGAAEDQELLHATLQEANLLSTRQELPEWGNHYYMVYTVKGAGDNARPSERTVRASLLHHRREDRTTLLSAMDLPHSTEPDVLYAVLAMSVADAHREEERQRAAAEEAAKLQKPIDWTKTSKTEIRRRLGKTYDPNDPAHEDFAEALQAVKSLPKEKFWHPDARYRYQERWLNHLVDTVKSHKVAEARKLHKPAPKLNLNAAIPKIMEDLGGQFNPAEPAHQELWETVASVTPKPSTAYRTKEEYAGSKDAWSTRRTWWSEETESALTDAEAEELHNNEVKKTIEEAFSPYKNSRAETLKDIKARLKTLTNNTNKEDS